ncbi:MAG TPA: gamma-butyrobetaine hydroxylase-like domain-containing protein [Rhodoferax sp.]
MNVATPPLELTLHHASAQLGLRWSEGLQVRLSAHGLRCACRCAACVKLSRAGLGPHASETIGLREIKPVGVFGIQLIFDDGHDRGIYPWSYLHELSNAIMAVTNQ